jgi:hypothetical protein
MGQGGAQRWEHTRGARGEGAEPSGAKGCGFESFGELPLITICALSLIAANKRSKQKSKK